MHASMQNSYAADLHAAKRILREVVAGIVEDAFHAGWKSHASGNGDTGPDYARRIINEECGE